MDLQAISGFAKRTRRERAGIECKSALYTTPKTSNVAVRPLGRTLPVVDLIVAKEWRTNTSVFSTAISFMSREKQQAQF